METWEAVTVASPWRMSSRITPRVLNRGHRWRDIVRNTLEKNAHAASSTLETIFLIWRIKTKGRRRERQRWETDVEWWKWVEGNEKWKCGNESVRNKGGLLTTEGKQWRVWTYRMPGRRLILTSAYLPPNAEDWGLLIWVTPVGEGFLLCDLIHLGLLTQTSGLKLWWGSEHKGCSDAPQRWQWSVLATFCLAVKL